MASRSADVVVAGVGGCGASTLHHLARRGVRVVGIDRFPPGHDRGSSHGETRVIRQAYFEHPDYVPLLRRAYDLWHEIQDDTGTALFEQCGLLTVGPGEGEILTGTRHASETYGVPLESVDSKELAHRYPSLCAPDGAEAVWEPLSGYLHVESCVRAYAERAVEQGAELRVGETILDWRRNGDHITVRTDTATYDTDRLILCPGAWASSLLGDLGLRLEVLRKTLHWYPRRNATAGVPEHAFFFEMPYGLFYGLPSIDGRTVKLAEHSGGTVVVDPLTVDRTLAPADHAGLDRFVTDTVPGLAPTAHHHAVCLYTMTEDGHFLVDRHPAHENVFFAAGFSGHGFKFMSAMGAILAELAVDGRTESPIEFLGVGRFAK